MNVRSWALIAMVVVMACDGEVNRRPRRTTTADLTDKTLPMDQRVAFEPPPSWERVQLPEGFEFRQPPNFTIVNAPAITCDASTLPDSVPVLNTQLSDRWPLTLAMRRGDLTRISRANGFTVDSTEIAAHGQQPGDTTIVRRGEGWMLLRGRGTRALLASVRAPNGCYLLWAGRGVDINPDTLGLVLGTVRFGPSADSSGSH